ncbi:peptide chain release factor [Breoghania corrubedonensis]|uniref:Peptide chain release factor n=1 Tax=Breoghania corrubedonensis TaxID=665038 RepID=A0A2T5VDA1_9HYPH|nr:peptide chain release factor H [Breoghania corrubedonensis]PTW61747.1 peptide chain release factor [Breoghania corrubedonensis]
MSASQKRRLLVTSGDGPRECRLAVALVVRRMEREAAAVGLSVSIALPNDMRMEDAPAKDLASALVTIDGERVDGFAQRWRGTVRWTAPSPFRPHHKRQNWFVGVFAVKTGDDLLCRIDRNDLRFETFRAGGPGGQHQNTTDSAVRLTHLPSGISVIAKDERSQHRNKQMALERLEARLYFAQQAEAMRQRSAENLLHKRVERGNPVRCFKGPGFLET